MLDDSQNVFPNNIVAAIASAMAGIDPDTTIKKRPLRPSDPNQSLGIWGALWDPAEESLEIGHSPIGEPTLGTYQIGVQSFIKDGDQERGLRIHSIFAARVRRVLYRDQGLRVSLASMSVIDGPVTESFRRWRVGNQRYMNNDIDGTFVFAATVECFAETEVK